MLDGRHDGAPWVSSIEPKFPQEIEFRLRERRAWSIDQIRIHSGDVGHFLSEESKLAAAFASQEDVQSCWIQDVEVAFKKDRDSKWQSADAVSPFGVASANLWLAASATQQVLGHSWGVATLEPFTRQRVPGTGLGTLPRSAMNQLLFSPVEAEFVQIRINSNHGGPLVALSEVEVITRERGKASDPIVGDNVVATGHRPSVLWQILAYFLLTCAEVMISITCLEFSYTQAPKNLKSLIMGLYLLAVSLGNFITAMINQVSGTLEIEGVSYYMIFTVMMLVAAVAFVFVGRFYSGTTYIQGDDLAGPEKGGAEDG